LSFKTANLALFLGFLDLQIWIYYFKVPLPEMESKRQLQVANLIKLGLSEVFSREGTYFYGSAFVTIYDVKMTPDLQIARVYLSIYNSDKQETLDSINTNHHLIKKSLVQRIRNKLRLMPQLEFYLDETLDEVFKMDALFEKIKKERDEKAS